MKTNLTGGNTTKVKGGETMRFLRGQRGFTLVEILIAVAILAVLAGIAVPVVIHLRGGSETSAAEAELSNIQAAVDAMMSDQGLESLSNPVTTATSDMKKFPDWESDTAGGYVLYPDTKYKNSDTDKFIRQATTTGTYTCAADGTVTQAGTGY